MAEKLARIDAIGGPDTDSNYPLGWAMASNTPLRRYKFNTHGAGYPAPAGIGTQMTTQGTICKVRNRLTAGGRWIRTLGPPSTVSSVHPTLSAI